MKHEPQFGNTCEAHNLRLWLVRSVPCEDSVCVRAGLACTDLLISARPTSLSVLLYREKRLTRVIGAMKSTRQNLGGVPFATRWYCRG